MEPIYKTGEVKSAYETANERYFNNARGKPARCSRTFSALLNKWKQWRIRRRFARQPYTSEESQRLTEVGINREDAWEKILPHINDLARVCDDGQRNQHDRQLLKVCGKIVLAELHYRLTLDNVHRARLRRAHGKSSKNIPTG